MFYGNLRFSKVRKLYLGRIGQAGLVLLSCSLVASCTNPTLTNEFSRIPTPDGVANNGINSGINNGTPGGAIASVVATIAPQPSSSPIISPVITPSTNSSTNSSVQPSVSPSLLTQIQIPPQNRQGQHLPITAKATISNQVIDLEVASTPQQQEIGLMFRTELLPNRGMLFPFQPARSVAFWMKNTLIPLDMVFLHQGVVRYIATQVPPCTADPCPSYGPPFNVDIDQVIELRNGRAGELGLQAGDRLTLEFLP